MTLQILVNEYSSIQKSCEEKLSRLSFWEQNFKNLEEAVSILSADLQEKYEQSAVDEDLPEEIRLQLENRREGIRLSAKSASRLLRKLDPDKQVRGGEFPVVTEEQLRADLDEITGMEHEKPLQELVAQFELINEPLEYEQEADESVLNKDQGTDENLSEETVSGDAVNDEASATEMDGPVEELEVEIEIVTQPATEEPVEEVDITVDISELTVPDENSEEVAAIAEKAGKMEQVLEETVKQNLEALEDIQENLESVEKRFCNFIEKAVGPVMDGLHSGKKHGVSLSREYQEAGIEESHQTSVAQWLTIYDEMLTPVTALLENFSVALYEPDIGQPFDENTQEPIAVVEDRDFKDEDVKEIVRCGLQYNEKIFNQDTFLIRPAQVIVVKNRTDKPVTEETSAEGSTGE